MTSQKEHLLNYLHELNSRECINVGLFIYDNNSFSPKIFFKELNKAVNNNIRSAVNWIAIGPNHFIRFWENEKTQVSSPKYGLIWHNYYLDYLAFTYFLHNLVIEYSSTNPIESGYAWFPIEDSKETYRK